MAEEMPRSLRAALSSVFLPILLSACPAPLPVCSRADYVKPGVDIRELMPIDRNVPDGSAVVFGRLEVERLGEQGIVSVRVVRFRTMLDLSEEPFGEKTIRLEPDGRFRWIVPEGRYAIQPVYFHHDYSGTSYKAVDAIETSLEFSVSDRFNLVYLGNVHISRSAENSVQDVRIRNEVESEFSRFSASSFVHGLRGSVELMRHSPGLAALEIRRRKFCRDWQPICWGFPYGCLNQDPVFN